MLDATLFFAQNQRPTLFVLPTWQVATFPLAASPNYLDLQAVIDLARSGPVYANFRVASAFNASADNLWRFAIFVASDTAFVEVVTNPTCIVAQGHDTNAAGMNTVGTIIQVVMPPLSDLTRLAGDGRRYLALGVVALIPTADFTQGGIDAFLSDKPLPTRPYAGAAGW
ncbi:MAG: hypothetical protein RJA36_816 [Pseudomonadota bacterium]|jgi:hypothetical protein